ncbi:MAG: S8 family serine peptidase [Limisphaerales bacterium]
MTCGYILGIRNHLKLQMWGWNLGIKFAAKNENLMKLRGAQFLLAFIFLGEMAARAQNLDTIGVTLLQAVTTNVNGAGIRVAQPEAAESGTTTNWEVNPGASGVGQPVSLFTYFSSSGTANNFPNVVGAESGHADAVAGYFYGIPGGVATNVAHVDSYAANYFVRVFERIIGSSTNYTVSLPSSNINDPVVNQSFIFTGTTVSLQQAIDSAYDNYAAQYKTLFVSGIGNGGAVNPPATCYNGIGVGAYGGGSSVGPTLDNGRAKPDIMAPAGETSFSTPYVAGAAAVLMQAGLRGDGGNGTNSAADIRMVKALLLNGAIKPADWTNNAPSPLDTRYGTGVLNVFNSYEQLAGGRHGYIVSTSVSTGGAHPPTGASGTVSTLSGWDFNTNTSSASSDGVNHYYFNVTNGVGNATFTATATLVWNRQRNQTNINNLALFLYDAISSNLVACSTSLVDNVEHLFVPNLAPSRYDLQVWKAGGSFVSSNETYALAFEFFSMPLGIVMSGTNVVLQWPLYPAGFVLESATNLNPPVSWNTNGPAPVVTNNQNSAVVGVTNTSQFFQLWRP